MANTERLYPLAAAGARIVFFEPSCLSALREDVPSLLRGEQQRQAQRVSEACVLFEQFVEDELKLARCQICRRLFKVPNHVISLVVGWRQSKVGTAKNIGADKIKWRRFAKPKVFVKFLR